VSELVAQFNDQLDSTVSKESQNAAWQRTLDNLSKFEDNYSFREENPFMDQVEALYNDDSKDKDEAFQKLYNEGMELYKEGKITEAILVFEAAVRIDTQTSDGWGMLGTCHSEHDDDKSAIRCFQKSLENDQYHLDSLLSLGICYVNEANSVQALECLKAWVAHNPMFHGLDVPTDEYSDGSLMDEVVLLMEAVGRSAPNDKDVNIVLGVLYNVTGDYKRAEERFIASLGISSSDSDYSIFNKVSVYCIVTSILKCHHTAKKIFLKPIAPDVL
jgi:tetratricopeptide (TPR) repeat protein